MLIARVTKAAKLLEVIMQTSDGDAPIVLEVSRQVVPLLVEEVLNLRNVRISIPNTGDRINYDLNLEGDLIQIAVTAAVGSAIGATTKEIVQAIPGVVRLIIERGGAVRRVLWGERKSIPLLGKSGEEAEKTLLENISLTTKSDGDDAGQTERNG